MVMIHVPAHHIGMVQSLLEAKHFKTTVFVWFNSRSTDLGGPRLCNACNYLVIGYLSTEGSAVGRAFLHFNASSPSPLDRFNFHPVSFHSNECTKVSGKTINVTQKPQLLLYHLFGLLGIPGGCVVDCCSGSAAALLPAWATGREWMGFEVDKEQMTNSWLARQSDALGKNQVDLANDYSDLLPGIRAWLQAPNSVASLSACEATQPVDVTPPDADADADAALTQPAAANPSE